MEAGPFITGEKAVENAGVELTRLSLEYEPLFAPWDKAKLGLPTIVLTVFGKKSYWLVPVELQDKTIGFVRVMGDGKVAAVGTFYQEPARLENCPSVITGITAAEALEKAKSLISSEHGESAQVPIFVHDGPPGREAWLIGVTVAGKPDRWIFVTPGFTYERPAGELHNDTLEGGGG
jgi:hypothetical protein